MEKNIIVNLCLELLYFTSIKTQVINILLKIYSVLYAKLQIKDLLSKNINI